MNSALLKVKGFINEMPLSIRLFLTTLTMFLSNPVFSHAHSCMDKNMEDSGFAIQKVYVNYSDLYFEEDCIFLFSARGVSLVDLLGFDELGYFIYAEGREGISPRHEPTCDNGHPIYHAECTSCAH